MITISGGEQKIRAAVMLPGSKSISNRMLVLKSVLKEETELFNLSESDDTVILGRALELIEAGSSATIDIGQAGTDMRFLTAYLATRPGHWFLTGSDRMKQRPVAPLVNALRQLGADINYVEKEGFPPLRINGRELQGGEVTIDGHVSSQFVSALLLISPLLKSPLTIELAGNVVSRPYINMTLALMRVYGLLISTHGTKITAGRRRIKKPGSFAIESDWSSASYFYSLCALAPDAKIELKNLLKKSLQADAVAVKVFGRLGISTTFRTSSILISKTHEPVADFAHDFTDSPDLAQTVAVTCFGMGIPARLSGLRTLRIKETDRIKAMATELRKLGAEITEENDTLIIKGKPDPAAARTPVIDTYSDHRMALSFAPLVARYPQVHIEDPNVVNKSYPGFWRDLQTLGFTVILQP